MILFKKTIAIILLFHLLLMLQCKKNDVRPSESPEQQHNQRVIESKEEQDKAEMEFLDKRK
jgi:hypothetical protein